MPAPTQPRGVIRFQNLHNARHFVYGIFAQLRRRAMRRLAARFEFQPQTALVGGDDVQSRRLAHDGQIRLEPARRQGTRTGLRVFLVHQPGKDNGGFLRPLPGTGQFAKRGQHRGDGAFRIARTSPMQPAVFPAGNKLRLLGADGVEMRRQQDGPAGPASRPQAHEEIGPAGQDFLKFHLQPGARGDRGEKIRDALFPGERMRLAGWPRRSSVRRNEGGIDAGQRNEFSQQFFRARHAPTG